MGADYKRQHGVVYLANVTPNLLGDGTVQYFVVNGWSEPSVNFWDREQIAGRNGILVGAYCRLVTPPGGVASRTITLYLNGAPTAIQFVIIGAAQDDQDLVNAVAVTPFDEIVWHSDGGVGVPVASGAIASIRFVES